MRYPAFIGGGYTSQNPTAAGERTVNWYPEVLETPGAKSSVVLYPTPGVEVFATSAKNPVRAMFHQNGRAFCVIDDTFYEISALGVLTSLGTVAVDVGTTPATITSNGDGGNELFIVSGGKGYIYAIVPDTGTVTAASNATPIVITSAGHGQANGQVVTVAGVTGNTAANGTWTIANVATDTFELATSVGNGAYAGGGTWTAAAFGEEVASGCTMGAHLDGYFLYLDTSTSTWYISDLYDGKTWGALQFQQRSAAPDRWTSIAVVNKDIWLLGTETSEVWYNAGTTPFPFALHPSGVVPFGIAAPWSAVQAGDSLIWLSQTSRGQGTVVQATGLVPRVISTHALEYAFSQYSTIEDAVAWSYDDQGHVFYCLSFPTADATWVYDLVTQKWHERLTWDVGLGAYGAWRPQYHCFAFGEHLVGDRADGKVYAMSIDRTSDVGGALIRRLRRAPVLSNENKRMFFSRLELDFEPGLGTGGVDPQVTLNYSNDAGKTWTQAAIRTTGVGALGEYRKRCIWNRLGSARNRQFEVVVTAAVPWRLTDAYLEVS